VDLGIGQAGVVIDGAVHVLVADPPAGVLLGLGAPLLPGVPPVDPPAAVILRLTDIVYSRVSA
jgi:hypothetical protein